MFILPYVRVYNYSVPKGRSAIMRRTLLRPYAAPSMSGKVQPSGRFTLGFVPRPKKTKADLTYEQNCDNWDLNLTILEKPRRVFIRQYCYVPSRKSASFIDAPYLGKVKRQPRGTHGLTRYGKRYVREACYILESKYGVSNLGFYTLTLPSLSDYEAWEVSILWGKIYKYFFKLLRNEIKALGVEAMFYVGVSENQSKRSKRSGCPYYHLHFVMPAYVPGTKQFLVSADTLRRLWHRSIVNFVPSIARIRKSGRVDAQILRKSASGYLSKYFSKGADIEGLPSLCLPSSWYYSSREMKKAYKTACIPLSSNNCSEIISHLSNPSIVLYWDFVSTTSAIDGRDVVRGYYGRIADEYRCTIFSG